MELKHFNCNGKIVVVSKLNPMNLVILKNHKKLNPKIYPICYLFLNAPVALKSRLHNFQAIYPNRMNKSFSLI